ncbi:MAG TPA: carboxypeptidase-like regulatory domain-containing protein [Polyangia bacterium]|jgi:protein-S-isoprenylcysteine O-methyltransferase Ste14
MKALAVSVVMIFLAFGCATMKSEGAATLHVECNVPDAAVLLDDTLLGRVAEVAKSDKLIRPGFYRVEIRHPGYFSYFTEITVAEGGVAVVKAALHPQLE